MGSGAVKNSTPGIFFAGSRVRVHFNLHKAGFVVRNARNVTGDMVYTDATCVRNARFVVSAATVRRIRARRCREVGAWVEGDLCDCGKLDNESVDVAYNPFTVDGFVVRGTRRVLTSAEHVTLRTVNGKPITRAYGAR